MQNGKGSGEDPLGSTAEPQNHLRRQQMTRAAACGERQHIVVQSDAEDTYKPRGERCFLTVPVLGSTEGQKAKQFRLCAWKGIKG